MDEVHLILGGGLSVDDFLDQTSLFNEWEKIIPEKEYPIFVMAVLNNIRKESIINTIIASLSERMWEKIELVVLLQKKKLISHMGELPLINEYYYFKFNKYSLLYIMAPDIIFVLCVISLGFLMFIFELFSIDVTAMILLTIFFMLGYLTPQEALSGFSNPAVITIAFLFIISHALQKTRILEYLIVRVRRLADRSILLGRAVYLFTIGIASAVVNNTAIVAIFMPVSIRLSQKYKMSPSKMLIPLSYAAILGGTLTLVGTSTNLLVNSIYILEPGNEPMGMFEFTKYGIILMLMGLTYILFIAPMLLPSRTSTSSLTKSYHFTFSKNIQYCYIIILINPPVHTCRPI